MNKRNLLLIILLLATLLAACGGADDAGKTAELYINAVVAQNKDQATALSCTTWVESAAMEVDSFQAVTPSLEGLSCKQTGTDGDTALVACQGKIKATYGTELAEFDLSARTFQMTKEGGDWRVCGYR